MFFNTDPLAIRWFFVMFISDILYKEKLTHKFKYEKCKSNS